MISSALRYNEHIRHQGVTRRFMHADDTEHVLSYSSADHSITHWFNGTLVTSVSFPSAAAARECWRGLQRQLLAKDYWFVSDK